MQESSSAAFALELGSSEALPPRKPAKPTELWTEERNNLLMELWEEGLSAANIAEGTAYHPKCHLRQEIQTGAVR